jgi:hypothetical protein
VQAPLLSPQAFFVTPSGLFLVAPSPLFCRPEHKRGVPRHLRASAGQSGGGRRPEQSEGCLATLGRTKWGVGASLSLGTTE